MTEQEHPQYAIYAEEAAIPRHQRAWVWGVAALSILLCGLAAGWLFGGGEQRAAAEPLSAARSADGGVLRVQQETVNEQLRERIARLERALAGDVCGPAALEALTASAGKP